MKFTAASVLLICFAVVLPAAPPDRVTRRIDTRQTRAIPGVLHHSAQPQFDRGAVDPQKQMSHMLVLLKPSSAQQADLDRLLADQQNPASDQFHVWLTPENFGDRFGLSAADHSKVVAWLRSEGFTINESARARNWVAFTGTADQVGKTLHTSIHRFQVDGETHFANASDPSVPEALGDVVDGFLGLNDFNLKSNARLGGPVPAGPNYNSGSSHYLAPADLATIYDIAPLYEAGFDGTGQSIVVVGQTGIVLSDLRAFRSRFNLPASDPKVVLYGGADPGVTGDLIEADLDLEWSGAIAPKATLYYVYGSNVITALVAAVNLNLAPVITISYGGCEVNAAASYYRSFAQQGNAQGITILAASGDAGPAGCDSQGSEVFATRGRAVDFPAVLPEVTGVGGTQFVEGGGTYWAAKNAGDLSSALSYIPEAAWNESGTPGMLSGGGGTSLLYARPAWQNGPGVPTDSQRHVPDIALTAALHDAFQVVYNGSILLVGGTSASAPSMAGIVALLNQYQVAKKFQKQPGLGNINPQLYRLAQSAPSAFHDIVSGDIIVPCAQSSPDCLTGSLGYAAGPGYDMATGLGTIDANNLISQWNTASSGVLLTLSLSPPKIDVNGSAEATVTVAAASGSGVPTGTVDFSVSSIALGSAALTGTGGTQTATLSIPVYRLGVGTFTLSATYSGDTAFSSGGATARLQVTLPANAAGILLSGPYTVWPSLPDAQGLSWQTFIRLREVAGVPAMVTGFSIDGRSQPLAQYFPSQNIPANGAVSINVVFRNLTAPLTHTFVFTGLDANNNSFTRQIVVPFVTLPTFDDFNLSATPLTVFQNPATDAACQWATQINIDDVTGFKNSLVTLTAGGIDLSAQIPAIFGTSRLEAWGGLQGRICFSGITPPASNDIFIGLNNGNSHEITVSFAGPAAGPVKLSATPANISLVAASGQLGQATLSVTSSGAAPWTVSVFPRNRSTSWLTASQFSGSGPAQVTLTANATGFEPGVYRAMLVLESDAAVPQVVNVPVMFVLGGSPPGTTIFAAVNSFSGEAAASPGMLLSVFGSNLSDSTQSSSGTPLPYSVAGVSATVNGMAAPVLYVSPGQVNIQIPFEAGSGPAVLAIDNNGQIAGFPFQIAAASPGIVADASHNMDPETPAQAGTYATLYLTGAGEVTPALRTAYAPSAAASIASLPKPVLPLNVTVGGIQAFVQFAGMVRGSIGVMQVNFQVPASVPAGVQPVIVTIGGFSSPAANLMVLAPGPGK